MKYVVVGTAGHIDHGKSALVKALTGTDPDRLKEEKERGITIDLGFAFLSEPSGRANLGFVDVPGHERFVKNMLAGATGIDVALLVVAADESVMPQTREHFEICRLLGIRRGIVAITKVDLVEKDMRELAALEVRELVTGSFLDGAPSVFVSSKTGEGIEDLKATLFRIAEEVEVRPASGIFRLPVDRVFTMKGFGTVVTGTLISGKIAVDEEVEVLPRTLRARVRGLQVHGRAVEEASAGQRTAVNLQGVDVSDVERGATLVRPGTLAGSFMVDAELTVLASSPVAVKDLSRIHLHLGTSQVVAQVRVLGGKKALPPGAGGLVQLRLEAPVVAAPGDRFIVRRYSPLETIGGGVVLDASPRKHRVASEEEALRLTSLQRGDAARLFAEEAGARGVRGADLARRLGVDEAALAAVVNGLAASGAVFTIAEKPLLLVSAKAAEDVSRRMVEALQRFQRANPLLEGMSRGELREKIGANEIFEWALSRDAARGLLRIVRDRVATSDHRIELSREEGEARAFLVDAYRRSGYQPQSLSDLASARKTDPRLLERIQKLLLQEGELVRVAEGLVFHRDVLQDLKRAIHKRKETTNRIDVAFFKDLAGVSRKYAIPLLEWLDRERVTRREGNERVIL